MKYISLIITCLVCTTSFSQSFPTNAINVSDSASKKIVIKYTTNRNGKVITVSYLQKESTTSEELLIREAKLMTLKARPVIYTPEGFRRYGSYVFFFTATGKLLVYFQNSSMTLRGKAKNTNTGFSSPKGFPLLTALL